MFGEEAIGICFSFSILLLRLGASNILFGLTIVIIDRLSNLCYLTKTTDIFRLVSITMKRCHNYAHFFNLFDSNCAYLEHVTQQC